MAESGGGDENVPKKPVLDREERLRVLRERQSDERLRRLEDLKKQALEAQQIREQKEAERRRRMEDMRQKENERRSQVEGRKKIINEAEQERREAILRKNLERDARLDAKRRNEKSSIVFAFGSSTPRLLETYDSMYASYWGPRRATSTANLRLYPGAPVDAGNNVATNGSRRPSERDQQDGKKRAASAGGLYRTPADKMATSMYEVLQWCSDPLKPPPYPQGSSRPGADIDDGVYGIAHVGRRKTDLMPTTPLPKDPSSRPGSGSRSLSRTPGRAVSMARLDQLGSHKVRLSRSTAHLVPTSPLRAAKSMVTLGQVQTSATVLPVPRTTRAERLRQRARAVAAARSSASDGASSSGDVTPAPSRPGSVMSQSSIVTSSTVTPRLRNVPRRPRPSSIHVTGMSKDKLLSPSEDILNKVPPKPSVAKKINQQKNEEIKKQQLNKKAEPKPVNLNAQNDSEGNAKKALDIKLKKKEPSSKVNGINGKIDIANCEREEKETIDTTTKIIEVSVAEVDQNSSSTNKVREEVLSAESAQEINLLVDVSENTQNEDTSESKPDDTVPSDVVHVPAISTNEKPLIENAPAVTADPDSGNVMTRSHITTEEEAKAILAERRRLAREQAEREAEAERQRLAKEAEEEAERLRKEEEQQRIAEEEQLQMIEEARKLEQQRLMLAIQEAQKKEEEEKERQRLEEQARIEKEEADRLAREEAERQRQELAERLKKEEEERQARRKRVEAIMKRTRNAPPANSKSDAEKGEQDGAEREKDESRSTLEDFLHGERVLSESNMSNGQNSQKPLLSNNMNADSHSNGLSPSGIANEDCVNSNEPALTPLIAFQGKAMETPVPADFLA